MPIQLLILDLSFRSAIKIDNRWDLTSYKQKKQLEVCGDVVHISMLTVQSILPRCYYAEPKQKKRSRALKNYRVKIKVIVHEIYHVLVLSFFGSLPFLFFLFTLCFQKELRLILFGKSFQFTIKFVNIPLTFLNKEIYLIFQHNFFFSDSDPSVHPEKYKKIS